LAAKDNKTGVQRQAHFHYDVKKARRFDAPGFAIRSYCMKIRA
jgi:hypothetical protein